MSSCSKELNQWEPLTEYAQSKGHSNPYLMLECAWRVSNWASMKEALVQVRSINLLAKIYSRVEFQFVFCLHQLFSSHLLACIHPCSAFLVVGNKN